MTQYKIIQSQGKCKITQGTYTSFGSAKRDLDRMFNQNMYSGDICQWVNNISYMGRVGGVPTTTYIKKILE